MTNLIWIFTAVMVKHTIPGWSNPNQKMGTIDKLMVILCYFLYGCYFLDLPMFFEKMRGSGWLFYAMIAASILTFLMDTLADLLCRCIRKERAQFVSVVLRLGSYIMFLVICALHLAMRITGVAFYASQDTLIYDIVIGSAAIAIIIKLLKLSKRIWKSH